MEAVANLRLKLLSEDPFYIFQLNDRNMNGKPTFVSKMSRVQIKLAVAMDRGYPEDFLNREYCFSDGTIPRIFNSISFVYVGLLRKMFKLSIMEAETEGAENWTIFWRFFNYVKDQAILHLTSTQQDVALMKPG